MVAFASWAQLRPPPHPNLPPSSSGDKGRGFTLAFQLSPASMRTALINSVDSRNPRACDFSHTFSVTFRIAFVGAKADHH